MNLIVQGDAATPALAAEAARLSGAHATEQVAERAFRLRGAARGAELDAWAAINRLDCAFMPEGRRFADLKLLALDMDSTLITIECIDEMARVLHKESEVSTITAQAMRGEIDYAESLRRRVALLKDLDLSALQSVYDQRLQLSPGAERLLASCKSNAIRVLLVSGGFTFFTDRLKSRLGLDFTISNVLELESGMLTGRVSNPVVDGKAKATKFREVAHALGASREHTVAIGDGANDLPMLAEAGISIAWRAKPVVRAQATCALNHSGLDGVLNLFE